MASSNQTTTADYIVVGGGTSGLVVANRLTEDPNVYVLVLEAGGNHTEDLRVNVPAFWTSLMGLEVDWKYHNFPQPQGKLLGGSSALNGQAFIALSQADISAWEKFGNKGWNWAGLASYLKKGYILLPSEDQETLDYLGIGWINEEYRRTSGPVKVSFPGILQNPLCKAWIDTFRGSGKITTGSFSGHSMGGYSNTATVDPVSKTRSYTGSAYAVPAFERPNSHLITKATAFKILSENTASGVKATGVLANVQGEMKTFSAKKEVILAAGVFNIPKLLELSGIGGEELLNKNGIPVIINNLAVGENLQDHLMTGVNFEVADGVITGDPLMRQEPEALQMAQKLYTEHKAGPFTIDGMQSHTFMPVLEFSNTEGRKLQAELLEKYPPKPEDTEYYDVFRWDRAPAGNFASLGCSQSHPFSRGSAHISSADIDAVPVIDAGYFSNPVDLEIMVRHVQTLETLRQSKELSPFFKPDGKRNHPDSFKIKDLEGAKKYVLDTALMIYYTCGSVSMLPREKGGVVDEKLVVYGTDNLRMVDALLSHKSGGLIKFTIL
ncbi:hypothetical protein ACMFMG_002114 [Clarireedia jacksonii]